MKTQVNTKTLISPDRLIALELRRAVAREADALTQEAQRILEEINSIKLTNAQINGLLTIACTCDTVSAITRFLEKQGSRRSQWQEYAGRLIRYIRKDLLKEAREVAQLVKSKIGIYNDREATEKAAELLEPRKGLEQVHLLLTREFVQSFATGYLWMKNSEASEEG